MKHKLLYSINTAAPVRYSMNWHDPSRCGLADDSLFEANNKSNNLYEDSNNLSTSPSNDYTLPPGYIYDSNGIPISISLLHSPSTSISPEKEKKNTKRINTKKFITKVMNSPRQVVLPLVNKLKTGNPRDKNVLKKEELHLQDHTNTNMNERMEK